MFCLPVFAQIPTVGNFQKALFTGDRAASKITIDDEDQKPHTLVGSYYTTVSGFTSRLILNNKGPRDIEVLPTLYGIDGTVFQVPSITVERNSHTTVNLANWAALGGESFREGNLRLFHRGKDLVLGTQIQITDDSKSIIFENKLSELGRFDLRRAEGVWWIPSNNPDSRIVLTNTSNATVTVRAFLTRKPAVSGSLHTFTVFPHQTRILDVRDDFEQGTVFAKSEVLGLSLAHDGTADALLAWAMVEDETTGYSNVAMLSNPSASKSNVLHGAGLQLGSVGTDVLEPILVVKNTASSHVEVSVRVPYTRTDGTSGVTSLNAIRLKAGEVRLFNMQAVQHVNNIKTAGIEISNTGEAGSIVASFQSVSASRNQVFRTLLWDPPAVKSAASLYPFSIYGMSSTKAYIKNAGFKDELYRAHLTWGTDGQYVIPIQTIRKGETVEIDVSDFAMSKFPMSAGGSFRRTLPKVRFIGR